MRWTAVPRHAAVGSASTMSSFDRRKILRAVKGIGIGREPIDLGHRHRPGPQLGGRGRRWAFSVRLAAGCLVYPRQVRA